MKENNKVKSKLDYRDLIHYKTIVSSYINDLKGLVDIFKIPNQTTYDVDNAIKASKEILRVIENRISYVKSELNTLWLEGKNNV